MAFSGYFEAPLATPAECGLFSVAEVIRHTEDDARWSYGYDQYYVTPDGVTIVPVTPEGGAPGAVPGNTADVDDVKGATFEVVIEEQFSGMGANHVTPFAGLQDIMDAASQRAAEYALWSGKGFAGVTGAHWLFDADADTVNAGTDKDFYLATAEFAISQGLTGIQGVIHMSRYTAAVVNAFQYKDGKITTNLGTPVVAGTGYGHDASFMAVTGPVVVHLGPIVINDSDLRNNFNPNTNTYTVRASRVVSVVFDPSLHVKITNI